MTETETAASRGGGFLNIQVLRRVVQFLSFLLFVAVEPAFITAIEHDPELVKLALDNNILLASPTNLMIALRTIENLWRFDQQEKNGRLIATQAGKRVRYSARNAVLASADRYTRSPLRCYRQNPPGNR